MRRFPTILGLFFLLALLGGGGWYLFNSRPKISEDEKPQNVTITNVSDSKFTVSWITESASRAQVEYGPVGEKLAEKVSDERGDGEYETHHVTIAGLQPATQYAFRVIVNGGARFDNSGSPYTVTTGPIITSTPSAESFYGNVELQGGQPAEGAIVYVSLPGAAPASTLVKKSGSYSIPISTIRTSNLASYVEYDAQATVVSVSAVYGKQEAKATVSTANSAPVPKITMGQTHDYRVAEQTPKIAEVAPIQEDTPPQVAETPTVFNVEPLGDIPTGGESEVVLLNPAEEGEELSTTLPEFRGLGPSSTVLSVTVHSATPYSDTVLVASDGTWDWTPPADLEPGEHTITIAYIDSLGEEQILERTFLVAAVDTGDPAFEASPSASLKPSATPSPTYDPYSYDEGTPTATPRAQMPSTESGVPVTGVTINTILTAAVGFVIMVIGAVLIAL